MRLKRFFKLLPALLALAIFADASAEEEAKKIVLVAGATKEIDRVGHHDYLGGCGLLEILLKKNQGIEAALVTDGWLNGIKFPKEMAGITPVVWSGKTHLGSSAGGTADVVGWTYDRDDGGRSFNFTGLDAHSAWERPGVRPLVVNGVLWSAGRKVPEGGAKCDADKATIDSFLTPRIAPEPKTKANAAPTKQG